VSGKNRGKKRFEQIVENSRNLHRVKVLEKMGWDVSKS
jgi:membrane carboxypeptidase/penicillin-binding protein